MKSLRSQKCIFYGKPNKAPEVQGEAVNGDWQFVPEGFSLDEGLARDLVAYSKCQM